MTEPMWREIPRAGKGIADLIGALVLTLFLVVSLVGLAVAGSAGSIWSAGLFALTALGSALWLGYWLRDR